MAKKKEVINREAFKEVYDRIACDTGLIFVDTPEETRLIREIFREFKNDSVQFWSIGQGLHQIDQSKIVVDRFYPYKFNRASARLGKNGTYDTRINPNFLFDVIEEDCRDVIRPDEDPSRKHIYILRDLDAFLKDPIILRRLKDLVYLCVTACSSIVISGYGLTVPSGLEKDAVFIKLKYPSKEEIMNRIVKDVRIQISDRNNKIIQSKDKLDDTFDDENVARACAGLTEDQILNTLQYTISVDNNICIDKILEEKKNIINKSDILEYWICNDTLDNIGGFGEIKKWFDIKKAIIKNPEMAIQFKADQPKGMMLLGVQGSGKTAISKALAQSWGVGLIKLDIGKVFGSLVGESEKRMRQALTQMDAAGGIVVIDEIDKSLSGAGSSDKTDGGTTNRVISTLLQWLSEEHPGVFLIATANDISVLLRNHPELFRKGRFDEIWFSDIPTVEERKEIFRIHLRKRDRNPDNYNIDQLAEYEYTDNDGSKYAPTGAEIESAIKDAIQAKLAEGIKEGKNPEIGNKTDITTEDIMITLRKIKPITKIAKTTIANMRKWSSDNATNVSCTTIEETPKKKVVSKKVNLRINTEGIKL